MKSLKYVLKLLSAFFKIRDKYVCEMSKDRGLYDFHDYTDAGEDRPWHFTEMKCKRCGKEFLI